MPGAWTMHFLVRPRTGGAFTLAADDVLR
jgi:hypothetical protein